MIDEAFLLHDGDATQSLENATDVKTCLFCARFFFADGSIASQAIKLVVGPVQHVEVIIIDGNKPTMGIVSFAAFVGGPLSMYLTPKYSLMDACIENIVLPISQSVATKLGDYYLDMHKCEIPYNYYDSRFLMPFWSPYTSQETIDDTHHTRVFCSQMVVLGLRECMDVKDDGPLIEELKRLNSRLTSPHTLLRILRIFGRGMKGVELTAFVQVGYDASNLNTFSV
jgi:hypothetical protein